MGIGLQNVRSRLQTLYGSRQALELVRVAQGTVARVRLPLTPKQQALQPA
jgi:LytS/YehU family sensor histidine kinase